MLGQGPKKRKKKRHVTCLPPTVSAIISSKVRGGWHWPQSIQSFHPLCETAAGGRWGHQNSNIQSFSTFQVSTDCRSSALHASVRLQSLKSCCAKHNIINAPLCMFFRTGGKWCSTCREKTRERVREGNETSSMLQKKKTKNKEDGRLLLTLFFHSWLSWKIDTKKRHTQDLYRFLRTHTRTRLHTRTHAHKHRERRRKLIKLSSQWVGG